MKRLISLILVILLGFSLFSGSAFADDSVTADDPVSVDDPDSGTTFTIYIYDDAMFCEHMTESFEKCYLNKDTKQALSKANCLKTNAMLREEMKSCMNEHARLKAEIEALLPGEIADCFQKHRELVPSEVDSRVLRPFVEESLETYNKTVEAMLRIDAETVDCYLELYYRGLNTAEQIKDSIGKLSSESGATAAAGALGIQLAAEESGLPNEGKPQSSSTAATSSSMVWISETGTHYHDIPNCGNMNPDKATQIPLETARLKYEWCEDCQPPR